MASINTNLALSNRIANRKPAIPQAIYHLNLVRKESKDASQRESQQSKNFVAAPVFPMDSRTPHLFLSTTSRAECSFTPRWDKKRPMDERTHNIIELGDTYRYDPVQRFVCVFVEVTVLGVRRGGE